MNRYRIEPAEGGGFVVKQGGKILCWRATRYWAEAVVALYESESLR